jgi:hypothetical protein
MSGAAGPHADVLAAQRCVVAHSYAAASSRRLANGLE